MSFLTERYFQILENHAVYDKIIGQKSLIYFVERHFICAFSYNYLFRSLQKDLISIRSPITSDSGKEAIRIISEMILEEEVDDIGNGRLLSHLELYLEAMKSINCDMSSVFVFFDNLEIGMPLENALKKSNFSREVVKYGIKINEILESPSHMRAIALFYEGEPYIPDNFLIKLHLLSEYIDTGPLFAYFNLHIEGLKKPGFSSVGRLVDILCQSDPETSKEAERAAEEVLRHRIRLWNAISNGIDSNCIEEEIPIHTQRHLRLVT
ncbi:MAG: DUF3050 domain-containing protein [Oligoflexales bacterium]|nr:DUF3050 domain-containing protein [Oligoflexales bacterium]